MYVVASIVIVGHIGMFLDYIYLTRPPKNRFRDAIIIPQEGENRWETIPKVSKIVTLYDKDSVLQRKYELITYVPVYKEVA